jgi:Carboxypeptidase regulatory-like domain
MIRLGSSILLGTLIVLALAFVVFSQSQKDNLAETGGIGGVVSDIQGAGVAHLTILLWDNKLHIKRETISDNSGNYGLKLPPGKYAVRVDPVAGFCKLRKATRVAEGTTTMFNIRLKLCATRSH